MLSGAWGVTSALIPKIPASGKGGAIVLISSLPASARFSPLPGEHARSNLALRPLFLDA